MCTDPSNGSSPSDKADTKPTLEQLFSRYPIQTTILQNLNFCDLRNLQRAGCHVPAISSAIQKKYLVPINCNEHKFKETWTSINWCNKSPQDVNDMKPCQGLSLQPDEPVNPESEPEVSDICYEHDGSDPSKCFWVCGECRDHNQELHRDHVHFVEPLTYQARLCKMHSLDHGAYPHNACRCITAALGNWRCKACVNGSIGIILNRVGHAVRLMPAQATLFGIWTFHVHPHIDWTDWILRRLVQEFLNECIPWRFVKKLGFPPRTLQLVKWNRLCPIENCMQLAWRNIRAMQMCFECKTVFPDCDAPFGP
ncbi:hypothetical protein MMC29_001493 [Sticta canariensis]|nr:hypothetical protein [Sticta canariensis]